MTPIVERSSLSLACVTGIKIAVFIRFFSAFYLSIKRTAIFIQSQTRNFYKKTTLKKRRDLFVFIIFYFFQRFKVGKTLSIEAHFTPTNAKEFADKSSIECSRGIPLCCKYRLFRSYSYSPFRLTANAFFILQYPFSERITSSYRRVRVPKVLFFYLYRPHIRSGCRSFRQRDDKE